MITEKPCWTLAGSRNVPITSPWIFARQSRGLGKHRPIDAITQANLRKLNHKLGLGKRGQPVSPVTHKRLLTFARMVFCFANEILDCNVKYRAALKPPEKRLIRERRIAAGERMFSALEIRALLEGHERPDMSEGYNQKSLEKQLILSTHFVYRWLQGLESL